MKITYVYRGQGQIVATAQELIRSDGWVVDNIKLRLLGWDVESFPMSYWGLERAGQTSPFHPTN